MGQKSDRQKVAIRPNDWPAVKYSSTIIACIIDPPGLAMQNNSSCKRSDSEQQLLPRHHTNPISPLPNVAPDFQKEEKKEIYFLFQNS
jgi:hypothetical protein